MDLKGIRDNYKKFILDESTINKNPFVQFEKWLSEAITAKIPDPTAMNLATADQSGKVSSRIVLLKDFSETGFIFFTNYNSLKGKQLAENSSAALNFFWPLFERQIRIEGKISKISGKDSDAYFKERPLESQISAIVSPQSEIISNKYALVEQINNLKKQVIKRPKHWGGYILKPSRIEFWQGGENRLHDRINFMLKGRNWNINRLAP